MELGQQMKQYIVLYREESVMSPLDAPFGFRCWADNGGHAEEQCLNAYPGCDVVWVYEGDSYSAALDNYWNEGGELT